MQGVVLVGCLLLQGEPDLAPRHKPHHEVFVPASEVVQAVLAPRQELDALRTPARQGFVVQIAPDLGGKVSVGHGRIVGRM